LSAAGKDAVIRALAGRVKDCRRLGDKLLIVPKGASFDELYVWRHRLGFSADQNLEFLSMATIFDQNAMDQSRKELYRRLRFMECGLKRRGFIPKLYFRALEIYHGELFLREHDATLMNCLNGNETLMESIRKSGLEELYAFLYFDPPIAKYYENPSKICWTVRATKGPMSALVFKKGANRVFDAIDLLSSQLKAFTVQLDHETRPP